MAPLASRSANSSAPRRPPALPCLLARLCRTMGSLRLRAPPAGDAGEGEGSQGEWSGLMLHEWSYEAQVCCSPSCHAPATPRPRPGHAPATPLRPCARLAVCPRPTRISRVPARRRDSSRRWRPWSRRRCRARSCRNAPTCSASMRPSSARRTLHTGGSADANVHTRVCDGRPVHRPSEETRSTCCALDPATLSGRGAGAGGFGLLGPAGRYR